MECALSTVLDLIGHTPLVRLMRLTRHLPDEVRIYAKLERFNPGGSVNVERRATNLSNASLGENNPGVNSSLQLAVGYNWWKQ